MTQEKYILYKKALAELYVIITYMKQEVKDKIPEELKLSINRNKDKNYSFEYDITLTLDKQNLLLETKALLSVIYTEYLCSTEEKSKWDEYDRFYIQNQERLKKENYKEEVDPERDYYEIECNNFSFTFYTNEIEKIEEIIKKYEGKNLFDYDIETIDAKGIVQNL